MRSVVRKLFVNFEKEEKWLNDMAAKGLNFIDYSFARYLFEEGEPGEYIYRLELLNELPSNPESKAYIKFMEEAGIECVGSYFRWVYFRKKAKDGPFVGAVGLFNLFAAISNVGIGFSTGNYFNVYISSLNWIVVVLLGGILMNIFKKIRKMKQDKNLYE